MKLLSRLFIALTFAGLATMLVSVSAHAGGLTFDAAGNLFVADGHSVSKFTVDGTKSTSASGLKRTLGLSFDSKGNLLISDVGSNSIYKLTPEGKKSTFASGISSVGMAFDRSGNLFVSHDDSIFKFTSEGVKSTFVSGLGNPIDLAFDGAGNLFVTEVTAADASSHSILKFSTDGTKNIFASTLGAAEPSGLACDRSGNVFVSNKHSILKFDSSGTPSTFASDRVSPDKQWEYRCAEGHWPEIVKAGTTQVVLDLSEDLSVPHATEAEVVWAPDSKRFAFNYSPPHAPHTSCGTIALYQLRGDKWVALRSPVAETSECTQLAQLAKGHLPKSASENLQMEGRN
jgi:hypothetical protein